MVEDNIVNKDIFDVIMTKGATVKQMTMSKFYTVAISRNLRNVERVFKARADLVCGEAVDGEDINMKGMMFRAVMNDDV